MSEALAFSARKRQGDFCLDVSFEARPGITMLFGPSGAGKTTVLDCVAGLLRPDAGSIALGERVLFDGERRIDVPIERRRVGYVFQTLALFPHLTVLQNVEYGLRAPDRRVHSLEILERFRIAHLRDRRPGEVSGGERQRVALARALVTEPCVLLLDEPLSALDLPTRSRLMDELYAWNDSHRIPILYVTHAREEALSLGEHVLVIQDGRLMAQGTPHEVLDAPRYELTAELAGVQNFFDATVVALHPEDGTMTCRIECSHASASPQLEVRLARMEPGAHLRIGVRAEDILLASAQPQGLSARNVLAGRVLSITRRDSTAIVHVDCGVVFEVYITPAAQRALDLSPGSAVWMVIKTYSCHLLR